MATNLVIPGDLQSRSAQDKADFYSTQRMAGFSDPAIRNAVTGTIGQQTDSDWNALLQLSGYDNVAPDSQRGSNPFGNSLINALRNNTPGMPAGSASSYTMLPNRAPAPPPASQTPNSTPNSTPNYLNRVTPTGLVPPGRNLTSSLPSNWANLNADQKIAYFNYTGARPEDLLASGVSQADVDWMSGQGFGTRPQTTEGTRNVISMLPNEWNTFGSQQKIDWYNRNNVTPTELQAFGVKQPDIDWMINAGYMSGVTPPVPTVPGNPPVIVPNPNWIEEGAWNAMPLSGGGTTEVDDASLMRQLEAELPSNWSTFGPDQKIDWFNANAVTPEELTAAGVTEAEIDWMMNNGYVVDSEEMFSDEQNRLIRR